MELYRYHEIIFQSNYYIYCSFLYLILQPLLLWSLYVFFFICSNHGLSCSASLPINLRHRLRVLLKRLRLNSLCLLGEVELFGLDTRCIPRVLLGLVLFLEADFVIQGASYEVRRHAVLCNSWLTCLPVQEMVRGPSESALLWLVSWSILWVLEVNESTSEVRLRSESCCLFQCCKK
jgi:hypothetical protein